MTRAQIVDLVDAHRPKTAADGGGIGPPTDAEREAAAQALAAALPAAPWTIEPGTRQTPSGTHATDHGHVPDSLRFARLKMGLNA